MRRNHLLLFFAAALALPACFAGSAATLAVPEGNGTLVIDGELDESIWQSAATLPLKAAGFGTPFPGDGESRAVVRGGFLCLSARLPESQRLVAISTGRNPIFLREDRVIWKFYTYAAGKVRKSIVLTVNPLGGFRLDETLPVGENQPLDRIPGAIEEGEDWRSVDPLVYLMPVSPLPSGRYAMATARIAANEWVVEAAIPLEYFDSSFGYMEIERIRVPRPDAAELSWHWPGPNLRSEFRFAHTGGVASAPVFRPATPGGVPQIAVSASPALPKWNAALTDAGWQSATRLELKREESNPRRPRLRTEVRLLHQGRTLRLSASMAEAETGGDSRHDDLLQVVLSPSGAAFVQVAASTNGTMTCAIGNGGIGRLWPLDCARTRVGMHSDSAAPGWIISLDIPLSEIAGVLHEPPDLDQWRVLIRRSHPGRTGSKPEISSFPSVQSATPLCPARYARLLLTEGPPRISHETDADARQNSLEAQVAALPKEVWSDAERKTLGIDRMLEKHLRARMAAAAEREKRDWQRVRTRADWEQFRQERLDALKKWMGPFPQRTPLRDVVTKRADYGDGFVIENVVFESRPHFLVSANLYLPQKITARIPAILAVHCHHAGKTQSELQDMGMNWARAGTAVLVMDQVGAGERVQTNPWPREGYNSRYSLGIQLQLAGDSLIKWMAWDLMRGIDLLLARPYIDPQRLVMIGSVAGGGAPAAVTAALDPRIAAVVPFNFGEAGPEEHYLRGPRGYDFDTAGPGWGGGKRPGTCPGAWRINSSRGSFALPWPREASSTRSRWVGQTGWRSSRPGLGTSASSTSTASARNWPRYTASGRSPDLASARTSASNTVGASTRFSNGG